MKNTQKGIALIALTVTVVVLVILTIITISNMQRHGIIEQSNKIAMEWNEAQKGDGNNYFIIDGDEYGWEDDIPPSIPQIIVTGTKERENFYVSTIKVEIIPGEDDWSNMGETEYKINGKVGSVQNNASAIEEIKQHGTYKIEATTFDEANNKSSTASLEVTVHLIHDWDTKNVQTVQIAKCVDGTKTYNCKECSKIKEETIKATDTHIAGDYEGGDWAATCTSSGGYLTKCKNGCGTSVAVKVGSPLGHHYEKQNDYRKFDNSYHQRKYICSRCSSVDWKEESHKVPSIYSSWWQNAEKLLGENWWKYYCEDCDDWYTTYLEKDEQPPYIS